MATAPPSLEDLIESVPECSLADAVRWLREVLTDNLEPMSDGRWRTHDGVKLRRDDVQRRYRLARAKHNRMIVQGVG